MGGVSYGQSTPSITITTPIAKHNQLSSWMIGTCRNHVHNQVTSGNGIYNETKFTEKQALYRDIKPVFGTGRKLYRLGGNNIDGGTEYGGSAGFVWWKNYDDPQGWNGQYPYDNLIHYIEEALEMDADLLVGINVATGSDTSAANLVKYLTNLTLNDPITNQPIKIIDGVAYFELGNELPASWIKGGCGFAANPTTYCDNIAPFIRAMRAENSEISTALMDGFNNSFDWGAGCPNWSCSNCGVTDVVNTYLNYIDPTTSKPLDFNYIAFHAYPQGWLFPHSDGSGQVVNCPNNMNGIAGEFDLLMSANQWSLKESIEPINNLLQNDSEGRGIKLVNTEFSTTYAFSENTALNPHGIVQALYTADNIMTSIVEDIPTTIAFSYLHIASQNSTTHFKDNVFFEPNIPGGATQITTLPIFKLQKLLAKNLGQERISSTENFSPSTVTFCNNTTYDYTKLGHVATIDNNGTIYSLIINRGQTDETLTYIPPGSYQAELHTISATSLADDQISASGYAPVTNLSAISIPKLSINILKLTPISSTCHDYTINTNTTWPDAAYLGPYGKVEVKSGATLTIAQGYEARFCTDGSLDISSGSRVDLKGSLTSCAQEWRGVSVEAGGRFTGNNGTIEHARVGISGTELSSFDNSDGVRIFCENTHFKNNATGVAFAYTSWPMTSGSGGLALNQAGFSKLRLTNCDFDVTDNPNFNNHVELYSSANTFITGCDFAYSQQTGRNTASRGILAVNSQFRVSASSSMKPSTFSDLAKGVEVIQMSRSSYILEDSQFDRCAVGVHNIGTTGGKILRNTFNMGEMDGAYYDNGEDRQIGVSYEGGTNGITLEENTFIGTTNWNTTTYGTTCRMLAPQDANVIRNNTFTDMAYANWAEENNGNADVGLHYLCNTHTNPALRGWNFIANDPAQGGRAMRLKQGLSLGQTGEYAPARNIFSHVGPANNSVVNGDNLRDFWVKDGTGADYKYYYLKNAPLEKPLYENVDKKDINDNSGNTCPRPYKEFGTHLVEKDKDEMRQRYFTHRKSYDESKHTYEQLKNSGSGSDVELAQKTMAYHRQQMDAAAYDGYVYALSDTTVTLDTIRLWMRRFANKTGDYMLAADYLTTQEYEMSRRVLASMQQKYDFSAKEMDDYDKMEFMFDELIKASGKPLSEGVLDKMESIATTKEGQASYFARELLSSDYGYFYRPVLSTLPKQYVENGASEGSGYTGPKMMVSPNPTDYQVHFDWSAFATSGKEVVIEVTNQTGGLIEVLKPAPNSTGMDWTTEKVSGNSCYYRLIVNGQEVYGGHIVINK